MVKAGTKQVVRWEKWVAEYRRWVGSGLTQRSYCTHAGLIFTQFKAGVEAARQQWVRGSLTLVALELAERIAIESTGFSPPAEGVWFVDRLRLAELIAASIMYLK